MMEIRCDCCGRPLLPMEAVEIEAMHQAFLVHAEEKPVENFEICEECLQGLLKRGDHQKVGTELLQAAGEMAGKIEAMYEKGAETAGCISVDVMLRRAGQLLREVSRLV